MEGHHPPVSDQQGRWTHPRRIVIGALTLAIAVAGSVYLQRPATRAAAVPGPDFTLHETAYSSSHRSPGLPLLAAAASNGNTVADGEDSHSDERSGADPAAGDADDKEQDGPVWPNICLGGVKERSSACFRYASTTDNQSAGGQPEETPKSHSIAGRVLDTEGFGLAGITLFAVANRVYRKGKVPARGRQISSRFRLVTDTAGAYAFEGLPEGDYTIRSVASSPYRSAKISARTGTRNADLVLKRAETILIEGRVFSADGEPLEGVKVLPIVLGAPSVLTDADGHYRLPVTLKTDVGAISLRFQHPGFLEERVSVKPARSDTQRTATLNVDLKSVEHWTDVRGMLRSADGTPLAHRTVELRPTDQLRVYTATTDPAGKFHFPSVEAPVTYHLHVTGAPDHEDYRRDIEVAVHTAEIDIVVEPFEFGSVSGRLVNLDGSPIPNFNLVLRHRASAAPNAIVASDADGNFEIPAAPAGEFVIASQSTPALLIEGLTLEPGDSLHVPIVLDWGAHELRGLVIDRHGNPVPATRIVLGWQHEEDGITTRATRRTAADAQGNFFFSDLGPGPHRLRVEAPGLGTVALNHDVVREGYDVTVRLN